MTGSLTIIHITDCHLLADPEACLHDWPVAAAFDHVLRQALERYPRADAIILGGDLVDDESPAGYKWLRQRLASIDKPVLAIAGNHDDPINMPRWLAPIAVHDTLCLDGWRIVGLCSHRPGREDGRIDDAALAELEARLAGDRSPTILAIHHPPLAIDCAWIDAIGLVDAERVRTLIRRYSHIRGVLSGHVHQAYEGYIHGCPVWTTPSTMRQFRPNSSEFAEDAERWPGYRLLELAPNGSITTRVHRCPTTPKPAS